MPNQRRFFLSILSLWAALVALGFISVDVAIAQEADSAVTEQEPEPAEDALIQSIGSRMGGGEADEETDEDTQDARTVSFGRLMGQLIFALAVTLGALFLIAWLFKRFMGHRSATPGGQIQVLSKSYLSAKSSIYVVRVGGKTLVVGEAPGGLSLLATLEGDRGSYSPPAGSAEATQAQSGGSEQRKEDFSGHLGQSREQLAGQALSTRLKDASRGARALADRLGRKE